MSNPPDDPDQPGPDQPGPDQPASTVSGRVARLFAASVRYGDIVALAPTSLTFERGSWVALVGSNGSGKSTLLGLLAGLVSPTSGTVDLADRLRVSFVV